MAKVPGKKETSEKFDEFLNLETQYGELIGKIAETPVGKGGVVSLPQNLITKALELTDKSIAVLSTEPKLKNILEQVKLWQTGLGDIVHYYAVPGETISMPVAVAEGLKDPILNNLQNMVHVAAYQISESAGTLKGCTVLGYEPDEAAAMSAYCSGPILSLLPAQPVLALVGQKKINIEGKPKILNHPTRVDQRLGVHNVKTSTKTVDNKINVAINYNDSYFKHTGSSNRLKGVNERLKLEGFDCHLGTGPNVQYGQDKNIYCWGVATPEQLRTLATYFSLLLNGDVNHPAEHTDDFWKTVRDQAWEEAKKINAQHGDNTWQSSHGQLNWAGLYKNMKEKEKAKAEKEAAEKKKLEEQKKLETLAKEKAYLYQDIRHLLELRDKHHSIEEQYGVTSGKVSPKVMRMIADNAEEFITLMNLKGWSVGGLADTVSEVKYLSKQSTAHNIAGTSDGIGNAMHNLVNSRLKKAGQYGNCSFSGVAFSNINTGNLATCEGALVGTYTAIDGDGNKIWLNSSPLHTAIWSGDEDMGKGYNLVITIPVSAYKEGISKYLASKGLTCTPQGKCNIVTWDLDLIREITLFFSHLKGLSEDLGPECADLAIGQAEKAAKISNKKGVFAFTDSTLHNVDTDWMELCLKAGIHPKVMKILGENKQYGGCSWDSAGDLVVPTKGQLLYCEGVRKNPQDDINAHVQPDGSITHYFHDSQDLVAGGIVIKDTGGVFDVNISTVQLYGQVPLQNAVKKYLHELWDFQCTGETCNSTHSLSGDAVRKLAAFLSSLHQLYKVEPNCIEPGLDYVIDKIGSLPNSIAIHDATAYPFEEYQWNKEVCNKLTTAPPPKPEKIETATAPATASSLMPSGHKITKSDIVTLAKLKLKTPYKMGGCKVFVAGPHPQAKAAYCAGVVDNYIDKNGSIGQYNAAEIHKEDSWHNILVDGKVVFSSSGNLFQITIPETIMALPGVKNILLGKLKAYEVPDSINTFQLKWIQSKYLWGTKITRLALFLSRLVSIQYLPPECQEKAVEVAWEQANTMNDGPLYPATVDAWEKEVCGKIETVSGPESVKFMWEPPFVTIDWAGFTLYGPVLHIIKLFQQGFSDELVKEMLLNTDYWPADPGSIGDNEESADAIIQQAKKVMEEGKAKKGFSELASFEIDEIKKSIALLKAEGKNLGEVKDWFEKKYPYVEFGAITNQYINQMWDEAPEPKSAAAVITPTDIQEAKDFTYKVAAGMSEADQEKAKKTNQYKKLPSSVKAWLHAWMKYFLLESVSQGQNYDELVKEVQDWVINTDPKIPLTPLMVKLQLDIEKKNMIRKGELPAEPGHLLSDLYEELPVADQQDIHDYIQELIKEGEDAAITIAEKVIEKYGLKSSTSLLTKIAQELKPKTEEEDDQAKIKNVVEDAFIQNPDACMDILGIQNAIASGDMIEGFIPSMDQIAGAIEVLEAEGQIEKLKIDQQFCWKLKEMKEPEPLVLETFILKMMKKNPKEELDPGLIHSMLLIEGHDIPEDEIKSLLEELTKEGKILWVIGTEKYLWNPSNTMEFEEEVEEKPQFKWKAPFDTFQLVEYNLTLPVEHIRELIKSGISLDALIRYLMDADAWQDSDATSLESEEATEVANYFWSGEGLGLWEFKSYEEQKKIVLQILAAKPDAWMTAEDIRQAIMTIGYKPPGVVKLLQMLEQMGKEWEIEANFTLPYTFKYKQQVAEKGKQYQLPPSIAKMPWSVEKQTSDNIAKMAKEGLSLPNIVQNAYGPEWENVKTNEFKEWVTEIVKNVKKTEDLKSYLKGLFKAKPEEPLTVQEVAKFVLASYGTMKNSEVTNALYQLIEEKFLKSFIKGGITYYQIMPQGEELKSWESLTEGSKAQIAKMAYVMSTNAGVTDKEIEHAIVFAGADPLTITSPSGDVAPLEWLKTWGETVVKKEAENLILSPEEWKEKIYLEILGDDPSESWNPDAIEENLKNEYGHQFFTPSHVEIVKWLNELWQEKKIHTTGPNEWQYGPPKGEQPEEVETGGFTGYGKYYDNLNPEEKKVIDDYILQQSDYPTETVADFVYGTYGVPSSDALTDKIIEVQGGYKPEEESPQPYPSVSDMKETDPKAIKDMRKSIKEMFSAGMDIQPIADTIGESFMVNNDDELTDFISSVIHEGEGGTEEEEELHEPNMEIMMEALEEAMKYYTVESIGSAAVHLDVDQYLQEHGFSKPSSDLFFQAIEQYKVDYAPEESEAGAKLIKPPLKNWVNLTIEKQKEIAKWAYSQGQGQATEEEIWNTMKTLGYDPETLPKQSVSWLIDYGKELIEKEAKPKEKTKQPISTDEMKNYLLQRIESLTSGGYTSGELLDWLNHNFTDQTGSEFTTATLIDTLTELHQDGKVKTTMVGWQVAKPAVAEKPEIKKEMTLGEVLEAKEEAKEQKYPDKILDENITTFIKMGWSPQAVVEFMKGDAEEKKLKSKAEKLYKIYKPEIRIFIIPWSALATPIKAHLEQLAADMLAEGKSVADVAWYIAHNYSVEKDSVRLVVDKIAKKPLPQVAEALKAFKLLGIGSTYAGCKVQEEMSDVSPQAVAFCQGILTPFGKENKSHFDKKGRDAAFIRENAAGACNTIIEDGKWITSVLYAGTIDNPKQPEINKGIVDILSKLGMKCDISNAGLVLSCGLSGQDSQNLSIADQDKIRKAAILLSMVEKVPELEPTCIPKALKFSEEKMKSTNQTSKPWTVPPYPYEVEDWDKVVCSK